MKKKYTILKIKVDKVRLENLYTILKDANNYGVPGHASLEIKADPTGTHITFEWWDDSELELKSKLNYNKYVKPDPFKPTDKYKNSPF